MNTYAVYYTIPCYLRIDVEAESEEEARKIADDDPDLEDGGDWETDWDAEPDFAFAVQIA